MRLTGLFFNLCGSTAKDRLTLLCTPRLAFGPRLRFRAGSRRNDCFALPAFSTRSKRGLDPADGLSWLDRGASEEHRHAICNGPFVFSTILANLLARSTIPFCIVAVTFSAVSLAALVADLPARVSNMALEQVLE